MAKNRSRNRPQKPMPKRKAGMTKLVSSNNSSVRDRAFDVLSDMRSDPSLTLTQASRNRKIDPRSVRKLIPSGFRKDSSGRIKARSTDRFHRTLYIPSFKPGLTISVVTTKSEERRLIGKWLSAINAAGRDDFSKLKKFPRGQVIGGVRLPTGTHEVQRILNALAEEEAPFEGLYRNLARPS